LDKLGAIGPGLANERISDDTVFIMDNFGHLDEVLTFIRNFIIGNTYPIYHTLLDEEAHQYFKYSIQALLKEAGFELLSELKRNSSKILIYYHGQILLQWTQQFIKSFPNQTMREYCRSCPIFSLTEIFEDWADD
jgi:hypothetical protein